jgi:hypothetical protein
MRPVAQPDDPIAALTKAEATWEEHKPASYEFTIEVRCFCRLSRRPPSFRVTDGQPVPIRAIDAGAQGTYESYNTIEKLFDALRRIATMGPHRMAVKYDPALGYPVSADIDVKERVKDDELLFRVRGFKVISEPEGHLTLVDRPR